VTTHQPRRCAGTHPYSCCALSGWLDPSDCTAHTPVRAHPLSYQRGEPEGDNPEPINQGCGSQPDRCAGEAREYGREDEGQVCDGVSDGEELTSLLGGARRDSVPNEARAEAPRPTPATRVPAPASATE
jgi:hypothetical protein